MSQPRRQWIIWTSIALIAAGIGAAAVWPRDEYAGEIREACAREGVSERLVRAIIAHESGFDAGKRKDGGYGLMQIGSATGAEWAAAHGIESFMATDLLDARTNTEAGCWYLARALERWKRADDPVVFALADYSAGADAVRSWSKGGSSATELREAMRGTEAGEFVEDVLKRVR